MATYKIGFDKLGIELNKVTSTGYTTCPACSEERKQGHQKLKVLKVYEDTGYYHCNHCQFDGRVDSDEWIEKQHGLETGLIKPQYEKPQTTPKTMQTVQIKPFHTNELNEQAISFLATRGISEATATACKVSQNKGCLCFNYYKGDEIIGAKYRKIDVKFFWQHAGCKKYLYGLNDIEGQDTIIIVEGEFDKLAFYEAGFKNCVSVSQGAPNEGSEVGTKLQCLDNSIDYIKNAKKVILACDNDPNGIYLTKILIERFGADRCAVIEFPVSCKDANEVLTEYGKEFLAELVSKAQDTPIAGVRTVEQVSSQMWDIYDNGFRKGIGTGLVELNGHFSFYKPWWNLYYGIPNSGKSAYVLFLMMSMAVNVDWKWAVFSPEHYPAEDFYTDCIKILTGKEIELNKPNRITKEEYKVAMAFLETHFFFVYPEDDKNAKGQYMSNSCDNIIDKIKELKLSKNIDGFLIDPFNQMARSESETNKNTDAHLEEALGKVDRLCKTHNLCGNITAHPRTMYKEKDMPDYRKPTPYECAGGAMWYNKAYTITCIHRPFNQSDKDDKTVEIDIQKIKSHKRAGKPTSVDLQFNSDTEWYKAASTPDSLSALFGRFQILLVEAGIEQKETFRSKIENTNISPAGFDMDKCPF